MTLKERVIVAAGEILASAPDGLTDEALARQMPPGQVASALREQPRRFVQGTDGRWRLRKREGILTPEEAEASREAQSGDRPAAPSTALRQGCSVVFDLEATGQEPQAPETEIIQIAAWRWDVDMLGGIVVGLERELHSSATGAAVYDLLRRAGAPWIGGLAPPSEPALAADIIARFGANITPLLPERPALAPVAPNLTAVDRALAQAEQLGHTRREPQIELAHLVASTFAAGGYATIEAGTGTGKTWGTCFPQLCTLLPPGSRLPSPHSHVFCKRSWWSASCRSCSSWFRV